MITPSELDEMEKRCEKATPGPWKVAEGLQNTVWKDGGSQILPAQISVRKLEGHSITFQYIDCLKEDAIFVAHARTDLPRLIAEVRRLREALEFINEQYAGGPAFIAREALEGK